MTFNRQFKQLLIATILLLVIFISFLGCSFYKTTNGNTVTVKNDQEQQYLLMDDCSLWFINNTLLTFTEKENKVYLWLKTDQVYFTFIIAKLNNQTSFLLNDHFNCEKINNQEAILYFSKEKIWNLFLRKITS